MLTNSSTVIAEGGARCAFRTSVMSRLNTLHLGQLVYRVDEPGKPDFKDREVWGYPVARLLSVIEMVKDKVRSRSSLPNRDG